MSRDLGRYSQPVLPFKNYTLTTTTTTTSETSTPTTARTTAAETPTLISTATTTAKTSATTATTPTLTSTLTVSTPLTATATTPTLTSTATAPTTPAITTTTTAATATTADRKKATNSAKSPQHENTSTKNKNEAAVNVASAALRALINSPPPRPSPRPPRKRTATTTRSKMTPNEATETDAEESSNDWSPLLESSRILAGLQDSKARIRVNVSGQYFDLRLHVLDRHPETLLGDPEKRKRYYDAKRDEYFLDRHRPSFEAIFNYYLHGGRLKRPNQIPDDIFLTEIVFHELETNVIMDYKRLEGYTEEEMLLPENKYLQAVWKLFEYPETSNIAFLIALVSVSMTLAAIVLLCVETLPAYVDRDCLANNTPNWLDAFFIVETICNIWFTFELIVRLISCPSKLLFWKDFKNCVDVVAILPYFFTLFAMITARSCTSKNNSSAVLAFLRVIRLVRIFKLTKHSVGLQVLILTFRASIEGLGMFLVALTVSMLVYSSAIYYAEHAIEGSQIQSIPDAFWWAIITMTTVGYGDKVPIGPLGRLIGAACAISGILTLAIPVPIIAGHFNRFYSHKTGRARLQLATG